jgi:tubulin polyglutamylase TTLL4
LQKPNINENPNFYSNQTYSNYCIIYKAYKNIPECLTIPFEKNGIIRTRNFLLANLIWKLLKFERMSDLISKLNDYQRYNHFPSTWQLGRKDNLWKNFFRMKSLFVKEFNFMPLTYIFPEDKNKFHKNYDKEKMYIIKPVASSRGRGIRLLGKLKNIPERCLISEYISNPLIINNKKFDLRLYVVITSYNPLKIYLYDEGLVRFASEDYELIDKDEDLQTLENDEGINIDVDDEENINNNIKNVEINAKKNFSKNKFSHITNYSVNKISENYDKNISDQNQCIGSKWSLSALRKYFKENNLNFEETWKKVKDLIVKAVILNADETINTVREITDKRNNLFELYGFDVLLDINLNSWLLEINLNPSLNCETNLDLKIKTTLITDIMNLIGLVPYNHTEKRSYNQESINNPKTLEEDLYNIRNNNNYNNNYINFNNGNKNNNNYNENNNDNNTEGKIISLKRNIYANKFKASDRLKIEKIKEEFDKDREKFSLKEYLRSSNDKYNYLEENFVRYVFNYTKDEFLRSNNFCRLFPYKENINYYSEFILNPEIENIVLWSLIKDGKIE